METGYRVGFEADQPFLNINCTFLRDRFSFSKAPNTKEQIYKRPLESLFQVLRNQPLGSQLTLKFWFELPLVEKENFFFFFIKCL